MTALTLFARGNLLWTDRVCPNSVAAFDKVCKYYYKSYGKDRRLELKYLYQLNPTESKLETLAGLRERLIAALKGKNFTVSFQRTDNRTLKPDFSKLREEDLTNLQERDDQVKVIGLICDSNEGFLVDAPTGWGKSYLLVQTCALLPAYRIAVVAPSQDIAKMLYERLYKRERDVGLVGDGNSIISRVTVSTTAPKSLERLSGVAWDLLLFDEAHRAGSPVVARLLASIFPTAKCVGFSASPTGRSDGADRVIEALFGKVLYHVSYSESVESNRVAPIKVQMHYINKGPIIDSDNMTVVNAVCVWRNSERNRYIAKVARDLPEDAQVLILTSTAEHAIRLWQLLPEYKVVFSGASGKWLSAALKDGRLFVPGVKGGVMDRKYKDALRHRFEVGSVKKVIATNIWATGVDFRSLSWLIRTDARASDIQSIQSPGRLSRVDPDKDFGTVIDFMDCFHPVLERHSVKRMRMYVKKEWDVSFVGEKRRNFSEMLLGHSND